MSSQLFWVGRILAVAGALAIIISIRGVGLPGILGIQDLSGKIVLAIATIILAVGSLLIGVSKQEQPV